MSVMAVRIAGKPPLHEVAYCGIGGDSDQEMENANARLIAAAPDLLAVARLVEIWSHGIRHWTRHESLMVKTALAAIEKAEGKAP